MYNIIIYLYLLGIAIASLFSTKVRKMWRGERDAFKLLKEKVDKQAQYLWFHAASLGEFEQGRPLIERISREHPGYKILLTFFSPSGYEVRKNYSGADIVCYLPLDTPLNARRFLKLVHPRAAFFIKYEFWYNYLHILKRRGTPTYSVSSIFRSKQLFFKWYGKSYARVLSCFTHFFVQNEQSRELLAGLGLNNVSVTGDTRFDRVLQIKEASRELPIIKAFCKDRKTFVAGSSWAPDEELFIPYFNRHAEWKLVIAPHVVSEEHLQHIAAKVKGKTVRYTQTTSEEAAEAQCLIIDCFGLLSSIYRYGSVAYVGGGFGVGIHNVIEAAVWGIPVIFGPNNQRFQEAQGLLSAQGGKEIASEADFEQLMNNWKSNPNLLDDAGQRAAAFVASLSGATARIMAEIKL